MEKSELMPLLFSDADFDLMRRVHDVFNPDSSLNPGKIFPLSKGCGEIRVRKPPAHAASTKGVSYSRRCSSLFRLFLFFSAPSASLRLIPFFTLRPLCSPCTLC